MCTVCVQFVCGEFRWGSPSWLDILPVGSLVALKKLGLRLGQFSFSAHFCSVPNRTVVLYSVQAPHSAAYCSARLRLTSTTQKATLRRAASSVTLSHQSAMWCCRTGTHTSGSAHAPVVCKGSRRMYTRMQTQTHSRELELQARTTRQAGHNKAHRQQTVR